MAGRQSAHRAGRSIATSDEAGRADFSRWGSGSTGREALEARARSFPDGFQQRRATRILRSPRCPAVNGGFVHEGAGMHAGPWWSTTKGSASSASSSPSIPDHEGSRNGPSDPEGLPRRGRARPHARTGPPSAPRRGLVPRRRGHWERARCLGDAGPGTVAFRSIAGNGFPAPASEPGGHRDHLGAHTLAASLTWLSRSLGRALGDGGGVTGSVEPDLHTAGNGECGQQAPALVADLLRVNSTPLPLSSATVALMSSHMRYNRCIPPDSA